MKHCVLLVVAVCLSVCLDRSDVGAVFWYSLCANGCSGWPVSDGTVNRLSLFLE